MVYDTDGPIYSMLTGKPDPFCYFCDSNQDGPYATCGQGPPNGYFNGFLTSAERDSWCYSPVFRTYCNPEMGCRDCCYYGDCIGNAHSCSSREALGYTVYTNDNCNGVGWGQPCS